MWNKIQETVQYIKEKTAFEPEIGIVLGSGLGNFTQEITIEHSIAFSDIPHFPTATVEGHRGRLILGTVGTKKVMAMQGRFHYYEGYDLQQVTFPIRVMKFMGIDKLIVSNASGGVNPDFKVGDVMMILDHINFMPEHPLRGKNDDRFGPRFLNMHNAYNRDFIQRARNIAQQHQIDLKEGVYFGLQGPTFETLAEYKMVRVLGGDCVGMSTVSEVIVARHLGMECFGISIISDMGDEEGITQLSHDEVLKAVQSAEPHARKLIAALIAQI
ncbi:purine-nucleoside phosphorylase [Flavobacterium sp. JP2137]|uniref:purine-nucleoside phosphorylase n=1 Tax=Flavobacterium sp. JP2137 TaxID=3414510 RepID=UPI003D2FEE78